MPSLADVVRQHGPGYQACFGESLLPSHARALRDIVQCRTQAMGGHLVECTRCAAQHLVYHSCRNRACTRCGAERAAHWVERQRDRLLPVTYFHVVFTLPAELRDSAPPRLIPVLCRAAFQSHSELCADPRHLGGKIGALAVLHTWTRALQCCAGSSFCSGLNNASQAPTINPNSTDNRLLLLRSLSAASDSFVRLVTEAEAPRSFPLPTNRSLATRTALTAVPAVRPRANIA